MLSISGAMVAYGGLLGLWGGSLGTPGLLSPLSRFRPVPGPKGFMYCGGASAITKIMVTISSQYTSII